MSEFEFSHQALSDVVPLRDVFGLLFFVTVGMLFDPRFAADNPGRILGAVAAIIAGKAVILGVLARLFGYGKHAPWIIGLGLAQIGEFSFVLARSGFSAGAIPKPTYDLLLASAVLTMVMSPLVSSAALPLARAWQRRRKPPSPAAIIQSVEETLQDHVVVGGYGRSGRAAARVLAAAGIPLVIVESGYSLWSDLKLSGLNGLWGDITSPEILRAAGVRQARILLVTIPDQANVRLSVERARLENPNLPVIARVNRPQHVAELRKLRVDAMVQPEFEGGVAMVRQALVRYGVGDEAALPLVADARGRLYGEP